MKLDRHMNHDGRGKYALLKLRRQETPISDELMACADKLREAGLLDFGNTEPGGKFFVLMLRDKHAASALLAYAASAEQDDCEYAEEIRELARIAHDHPDKKHPD